MGRFTEKQLTIMTIVVAIVITGLFAALIYQDLGAMDQEEQKIASLDGQIAIAKSEQSRIPARETEVIVYREIVKRDSAVLPDESEINKFINVIGDFEKFSGVVVTSIRGLGANPAGKGKQAILKIPLQLSLRGSMDQFLKFVNSFETYERFVSVTGFSITAGQAGNADPNAEVQHQISLQLETYQYDPKGGSVQRVEIPNYDRRLQETSIQKAIRSSKPAHIEKYLLKPRMSRRDPLIDPREAETAEVNQGDHEKEFAKQKAIVEKLILDVTLLNDDVRIERRLIEDGKWPRLPPITRAIDQKIAQLDFRVGNLISTKALSIPELKDQFIQDVVKPYEEIKEGRKPVNATEVLVSRDQVMEQLKNMRTLFSNGEYRDVINTYQGFLGGMEGRKFSPDAEPPLADMEVVARQAQVISKFETEPLRIGGVIIDNDPTKTSFAIINELIVAEGDFVDTDRKIQIREIRPDTIVFEYEGVQIPKFIRN